MGLDITQRNDEVLLGESGPAYAKEPIGDISPFSGGLSSQPDAAIGAGDKKMRGYSPHCRRAGRQSKSIMAVATARLHVRNSGNMRE